MKKIVRVGTVLERRARWSDEPEPTDFFCKVKLEKGRLSISGVVGPRSNGDAWGSCGQVIMSMKPEDVTPAPGWSAESVARFFEVWDRWHLNDMRPGCEHQTGPGWDTSKGLEVKTYTQVGTLADDVRAFVRGNRATEEEAALLKLSDEVYHKMTLGSSEPYPAADLARVLEAGYLKEWKTKPERAGSVYPYQHPDGLLCKPCPVCGYKYGSEWRREEVPAEVVAFLQSLPDTDKTPAWV